MTREMLVFDMDGVLVEVTDSYRECIRQTVLHFTGTEISYSGIQRYKNEGGWNNDWALSHRIAADLGYSPSYEEVVDQFQKLFLGENGEPGLIMRERWIGCETLFERLSKRFSLAIFTGRPRHEAGLTLARFAPAVQFEPIISADDIVNGKPHPEGLQKIQAAFPDHELWYIGDTVDDARSARAASVKFIGVASQAANRRGELLDKFAAENAVIVLDDINALETFFANR